MTDWKTRIVADADILAGKPVVKGSRIAVEHILQRLADGWGIADLKTAYPSLEDEDIAAVFAFAAAVMKDEDYIAIATAAA